EKPPAGPGQPEQAITLLQKGIQAQPDNWRLVQALGFIHYWWYEDYPTAARWFDEAAKRPGAPVWMAPLAAVTLAQGGNRNASRQMWRSIVENEGDDWFRTEAIRRLQQLDALDQMDALRRALDGYRSRTGRPAARWEDLVALRLLRGVPSDPLGLPYRLVEGDVALDSQSRLLPLPNPARLR
ncbi:MAG TPA: hypothetical protein VIY56_06070, partial [Vicinamibacterales bacterium]